MHKERGSGDECHEGDSRKTREEVGQLKKNNNYKVVVGRRDLLVGTVEK